MHEFSIVRELVETVERNAAQAGASQVKTVKVKFNPLSGFVGEHIRFSFDLAKKSNPMTAEAELVLEEVPGKVRCEDCGNELVVDELPNICSACNSLRLQPLETVSLVLESYEIEQ